MFPMPRRSASSRPSASAANKKAGLSDFWLNGAGEKISIPQAGLSDSLNVSNAAAICLFEAVRQRRK